MQRRIFCKRSLLGAGLLVLANFLPVTRAATVGVRPYEMDWAGRTHDDHTPLVAFENLDGWIVTGKQALATFSLSREQQIWGAHVGKLIYRATAARGDVRILPPAPLAIPAPFDTVTLWAYGNNWGYARDPSTPPVELAAIIEGANGREFSVPLGAVNWKEWFLLHRRLTPEQIELVKGGARFKALAVTGIKNSADRVLYFDNLACFTEALPPLTFEPRPARGAALFLGQSPGLNTGPGRLPFPTRPETILPPNATEKFTTRIARDGDGWTFSYAGDDGELTYRYVPRTGRWDDLTATWRATGTREVVAFAPCVGGGVQFAAEAKAELLSLDGGKDAVTARWRLGGVEVTYVFRLWNKSLVLDVLAPGGQVSDVAFGRAVGLGEAQLVPVPYYRLQGGANAVVVAGPRERPLFLMGNVDWYRSNASALRAAEQEEAAGLAYNGGTRYTPKTDGQRNDCFERFFLTVAPRLEEVLPVVDNPVSPWKSVTGTHVWRAHGASNRTNDARYWTDVHRHGLTQVVVTDHETGWRDGGESFTFRTRPAPGKGGDAGQFDYARLMQDQLGFVYGPYNNFTDFAPVNEYWSSDLISRTPENQLQHAWMRCYAPKPARAVEFCARLAPEIQKKFQFSTAYCDVHTAVAAWDRVDYDARVPGAGTCAAVFYAFGEIMLHQKAAWHGPVYSEGNNHALYCGLTDGNYGQDQSARLAENPWFVDFDLRRLHDKCCNFGMGNPDMFYASKRTMPADPVERDAWLDRFLAATVAFGHPGFLVMEGGMGNALRSYYLLQQLHSRYCLTNAAEILYADTEGRLQDASHALASGAFRLSQVVTRYADGTAIAANGNPEQRMRVTAFGRALDLPPNGWCGWTADGAVDVASADRDGARCDYADTPAYIYVDGRGRFVRFPKAASAGQAVCRILGQGEFEIIPLKNVECGFALQATRAVALDHDGKELGPAQCRSARSLTWVQPVAGAFSYRVTGQLGAPASSLTCDRALILPGEEVAVRGREVHSFRAPPTAKSGERLWQEFEGAWLDFTVGVLADVAWQLDGNRVNALITPRLDVARLAVAQLGGTRSEIQLAPSIAVTVAADLGAPQRETLDVMRLDLSSDAARITAECRVRSASETISVGTVPKWTAGICLRGQPERAAMSETGAHVSKTDQTSGGVAHPALAMHPPYKGGTGYAFAQYAPVALPAATPAAFRALVGKGDGSDLGDGILYRVAVLDESSVATIAAELTVTNHAWHAIEADLSKWAGHSVRLKLIADVGPRNNSSGDWACWAEQRLESLHPVLRRQLEAVAPKVGK
jgi:hypothetical protein